MKERAIVGIDEVGRGALAGPLVAAALTIIRPRLFPRSDVRDSKELTDKERREFVPYLLRSCVVQYGIVSHVMIDRIGIQAANVLAVDRAVKHFLRGEYRFVSDYIANFGRLTSFPHPVRLIINGDKEIPEISAASIMAKVFRDDIMKRLDRTHTLYNFARHKGYGTEAHFAVLRMHGPSPVHRMSFNLHGVY